MFRPPFLARVAAGAAAYAIEETRRLPTVAINLPITAISQMLQTTMHIQQFVTSLALKGDSVFEQLTNSPVEQPEWATFDEDAAPEQTSRTEASATTRDSLFDLYTTDEPAEFHTNGHSTTNGTSMQIITKPETTEQETPASEAAEPETSEQTAVEPEVAIHYDYANMTLAQLRARLRMLTVEDLTALLNYEQQTRARAAFVTMLTNRIATVQAQ
ncbi:lipid droplet-associated protein [Nocardia australiensis]|uniref:lipid droplet-associated protein n=1 Tax=Nocardia australiensis TaxID=2887191 RepID=UPI001D13B450|nr:lipid droplet-associated protein [Nocardia australiensis]